MLRSRDWFEYRNLVLRLRPVAYWPINDKGVNPGLWVDATRQGRDLTTLGGAPANPLLRGTTPTVSANFSGGQNGTATDANWQDVTTFSMLVHIRSTSTVGALSIVMGKGMSGTVAANPYQWRYNNTGNQFALILGNNTTSQTINCGTAGQYQDSKLHQLVVTVDGSNVRFYADGSLVSTTAQTVTPYNGTGAFNVGGGGGGYSFLNSTRMSNLALWDRAISAGDVRSLYCGAMS